MRLALYASSTSRGKRVATSWKVSWSARYTPSALSVLRALCYACETSARSPFPMKLSTNDLTSAAARSLT